MMKYISIQKLPVEYNITLEGYSLLLRFYYSKSSDRYMMDIENLKIKEKANGVFLNVGSNVIESIGRLGLQAIVPVSLPKKGLESGNKEWGESVKLIYMDNETYKNIRFGIGSNVLSREKWYA